MLPTHNCIIACLNTPWPPTPPTHTHTHTRARAHTHTHTHTHITHTHTHNCSCCTFSQPVPSHPQTIPQPHHTHGACLDLSRMVSGWWVRGESVKEACSPPHTCTHYVSQHSLTPPPPTHTHTTAVHSTPLVPTRPHNIPQPHHHGAPCPPPHTHTTPCRGARPPHTHRHHACRAPPTHSHTCCTAMTAGLFAVVAPSWNRSSPHTKSSR